MAILLAYAHAPPKDTKLMPRREGSRERNTGQRGYTKAEREALRVAKQILESKGVKTKKSRGPQYEKKLGLEKAEREARGKKLCGDAGGINQFGEPCGSYPLLPGTEIEGVKVSGDFCLRHDPIVPEGAFIRFVQEKGVRTLKERPKQMRPMQQMAMAMANASGLFFEPHLRSLGVEWDPLTGEMRKRKKGGAKIVGFSREGVARVSKHDDLEAQRRAANDLWDRMFGKPRQSMELAGGGSGMAMITIPQTEERAKAVANVLVSAGAVSIELQTDEV